MVFRSRNVILSVIVGFIGWGIAVKWIPALRYLGYAFAAGVACAFALIGAAFVLTIRKDTGNRAYVTPPSRNVNFVAPDVWRGEITNLRKRLHYQRAPSSIQSLTIAEKLNAFLDLILRDFVTSWHSSISSDRLFENEVDKIIQGVVAEVQDRTAGLDLVEVVVARIVPLLTLHMKDFYEAERAVRGPNLERSVTELEELDIAIAGKYRNGTLHPAVSLSPLEKQRIQQDHLRAIIERILLQVMPATQTRSRAVVILVRDIITSFVVFPLQQMLTDPDMWNQLIEAYGRTVLQDRKSVRKIRAALDQHASPDPKQGRGLRFPRLGVQSSERSFEKFIRAIRRCNSLSDARLFRREVSSQLRRDAQIEGQDPIYLRRLEVGKQLLDRKIAKLSTIHPSNRPEVGSQCENGKTTGRTEKLTLREVLQDPVGLSYFMEFMDRRRSMTLAQFWLVVEGLRNPLEDDSAEDAYAQPVTEWTEADHNDLAQINQVYLSKPELKVPRETREAVSTFLRLGRRASPAQYQQARTAIFKAQRSVLDEMQSAHFNSFQKSDLFFKYLTADEATENKISRPSSNARQPLSRMFSEVARLRPGGALRMPLPVKPMGNLLKRAATSTIDLKSPAILTNDERSARSSLDGDPSVTLPDEDDVPDPLALSSQSIDSDPDSPAVHTIPDNEVVLAMQAALDDIIESGSNMEDSRTKFSGSPDPLMSTPVDDKSVADLMEVSGYSVCMQRQNEKPSIASLGLVNPGSRIGVFSDDDLFPDEEKFIEDEREDPEEFLNEKDQEEEIHEAAPGDLGLAEAISALTSDINRLAVQNSVLDSLTLKAELTNNTTELRILRKSKASLQREVRRKELQRQQYIFQENDNNLYGRAIVKINSVMVETEQDGHEYALYVIEVSRQGGEQAPAASWVITRRYSEFHELHQRLRSKYPSVRDLDFPRRRVMMKLQPGFLHKRRLALENYLRELLLLPDVCQSRELRAFLSQQAISDPAASAASSLQTHRRDMMTRLYDSLTSGMEDVFGNVSMLDQISLAGQNLLAAATSQLSSLPPQTSSAIDSVRAAAEAEAELNAFESKEDGTAAAAVAATATASAATTTAVEPFVKPICDIFLELFELNRGSNWLRGRAAVVILHQLLGGTIERRVREYARSLVQDDMLAKYIDLVRESIWPNGVLKRREDTAGTGGADAGAGKEPRSANERAKSRAEAGLVLATLIPDVAGSVVGRTNALAASRKLCATLNNSILNANIIFTILDELVDVLFPLPPKPARAR